jgi:hypothetical protein
LSAVTYDRGRRDKPGDDTVESLLRAPTAP